MISPDSPDSDAMKYSILGGDEMSTEQKLIQSKGIVSWAYLEPHFKNQVLYFVDPSLNLEDVGAKFSKNDVKQVDGWIKSGDLVKISELHAQQWDGADAEFEALVVSPFVLCRPA